MFYLLLKKNPINFINPAINIVLINCISIVMYYLQLISQYNDLIFTFDVRSFV